MRRRLPRRNAIAAIALGAFVLAGCSSHYASQEKGVAGPADPSVEVFRSDERTSWTSFRLGDGLNVVVVNPNVPREFAWSFDTGSDGISSSPVVFGTMLLVDSNDHHLYAVDLGTGRILWRFRAETMLMSQPVYQNGIAVVATGTGDCSVYFPPEYVAMDASIDRMTAVNLSTGRQLWEIGLAGTGMPTPAILGNTLVHVDGDGVVLAVDPSNGAYRWHTLTPSVFSMTSVVDGHNGRIYAAGSFPDVIYAWNASNGAVVWKHPFSSLYGGVSDGPLASTNDRIVGAYLEPTGPGPMGWVVQYGSPARQHVYALDKNTGRLVWDRLIPQAYGTAPVRNEATIPLIYRNRVFVGSAVAPFVTALDVHTGRVIWQTKTMGAVKGGLVARDGVIYFGDLGGYLWAVDASDGRTIGRKRVSVHFNVGSPIVVNDTLIDGSREGTVIAVPLRWIRDARD